MYVRKCGLILIIVASMAIHTTLVRAQTVVSTTGAIVLSTPPPSVLGETSTIAINAFYERQNVLLSSPLSFDIGAPGFYNFGGSLSPGAVAAGTVVDSLFLNTVSPNGAILTGSVTLDRPIVGVMALDNSLNASDAIVGVPTTSYPTGVSGRDYEADGDQVTLSADRKTLTVTANFSEPGDELRIVTLGNSSVPEPGAYALLASLGLSGVALLRRRAR